MTEEQNQPPAEGTQTTEQAGDITPPPAEPTAETQPGAEEKPQKAPRTYTEQEWSEREKAKDTEIAEYRTLLARQALEQQAAQAGAIEKEARAQDEKAVEAGEITSAEAAQRAQQRQQEASQQIAARQLMTRAEEAGRILAAQDFGKKYNLEEAQIAELLSDKSLDSPAAMEAKAAKIALEKTQEELKAAKEVPQTFDSGQLGTTGPSVDSMSPEEKITYGLTHPPKKSK